MRSKILPAVFVITAFCFSTIYISAQSYEDYRDKRSPARTERPLSDERTKAGDEFRDELREVVRQEIDASMARERQSRDRYIDEDALVGDVRTIVREEIEDAIKLRKKTYLSKGTIEAGGFLSFQLTGLEAEEDDNNFIVKIYPIFNYFLGSSIALSLKGEAEFNLTTDSERYNVGVGPMFVYGITRKNDICFYTAIYAGISMNTAISESYGYRYANEVGFKFVMSNGVIVNTGVQVVFDNSGENIDGFQNLIVPTIGITAWF